MPQVTLSAASVLALVPRSLSREEIDAALARSKAEIASWDGDDLVIEVTPDRLDLLSEAGLASFLSGSVGVTTGLMPIYEGPAPGPHVHIEVDPAVERLRPSLAAVLVTAPQDGALDDGLLDEAIRYQEVLHATAGGQRRVASLGIYPWEQLTPPVRYTLEPLSEVRFVPLDGSEEVGGAQFFAEHPLALRYGALGREGERCLTLRDHRGAILSLPPVLNARGAGEARRGDRSLLLESTGLRPNRVREVLGLLLSVFVARGWTVGRVPVRYSGRIEDGGSVFAPREMLLRAKTLEDTSGLRWEPSEIERRAGEVRFGARADGPSWNLQVPAWRPDLLTEVDLVEDLIWARGVRSEDALVPPSSTRGRRRPESWFRFRMEQLLLGFGYSQLYTPVLGAEARAGLLGRADVVRLAHPPSEGYSVMRDALQLSLLAALEDNVRFGYPQRMFEVGPIVRRAPHSETGTETCYHAAACLAGESAGFADAAALADYLLDSFGALGVREPVELPGVIAGRGARVRIAGEVVAELGEIHPRILSASRVPVPVAWMEIDLHALWPLVRRDTDRAPALGRSPGTGPKDPGPVRDAPGARPAA
jgi:phenylalanyl-tRNA synthetase beta chain